MSVHQYTRLYNNPRWRQLRREILNAQPLCQYCQEAGRVTAADTVDHIKPHQGDVTLFWMRSNLRACCQSCHEHLASVKDTTGVVPGCNAQGEPIDPNHHWYQ